MSSRRRRSPAPPPPSLPLAATLHLDRLEHLLTALTLAVLALALIRCLVPVSPNLYWENDPRREAKRINSPAAPIAAEAEDDDTVPVLSLGPTGAVVLDTLTIAAAGAALLVHVRAGGRLRWGSIGAGFAGMVFCAGHLRSHIDNAFLCGGWIGAVSLALAALHLASRPRQRRWVVAALVALAAPLAIDAIQYVLVDHQQSMDFFKENEEAWLAARGWERGSPEHLMYIRRMEFNEPTGAFAFSNILGSIAAALTILGACIALGLWLARRALPQRWMLPAVAAAMGALTVFLTHSKGAPVALAMSGGLVALAWWARGRPRLRALLPAAAVACVAAAVAVVIVRGVLGPPLTAEGERSLLFRWHYAQAAARIAAASPANAALGVGPAQFHDDYNWAKNPDNPEEVRSAHNVFIDTIVSLGIGGWALSALLLAWLAHAARLAASQIAFAEEPTPPPPLPPGDGKPVKALHVAGIDLAWTIAFLIALFGVQVWVRGPSYAAPDRFLIWSAAMMSVFFFVAVLVSPGWLPRGASRVGLFAAAAVLLVHGQIEMTFFQASSAPLAWLIVAAAAAGEESPAGEVKRRFIAYLPGAAMLLFAIALAATLTVPLARQQALLAEAERTLRRNPNSSREFYRTLELLEQAGRTGPADPKPFEWRARLAMEAAANMNAGLRDVPPEKVHPQARQQVRQYVMLSLEALDSAVAAGLDTPGIQRQRAQMLMHAGDILGEPSYLDESVDMWRQVITRRPYAWQDRVELADLLWRMGRRDEARVQYEAAVKLSDAMYLEPTRMMSPLERRRVEGRGK